MRARLDAGQRELFSGTSAKRSALNSGALSAKDRDDASAGGADPPRLTHGGRRCTARPVAALRQFLDILFKPDNIPIAGMMVLVLFFTWLGFRQALRNDRLIEEGRADEILKEM